MKHRTLTMLAAAGGFLALPVAPVWAADGDDKAVATEENTEAVDAITVTTALIKGGG